MVLETKAALEAGVVGSGHRFAGSRLAAQRSAAGWVGEAMGGLSYLEFIRGLAKRVEADWDGVQVRRVRARTVGGMWGLGGRVWVLLGAACGGDDLGSSLLPLCLRPLPPWVTHQRCARAHFTHTTPQHKRRPFQQYRPLPCFQNKKADLERIRSLLLQRRGAIVNATGDAKALAAAQRHGAELLAALPADSAAPAADWAGRALARVNEALVVPTQVGRCWVGCCCLLCRLLCACCCCCCCCCVVVATVLSVCRRLPLPAGWLWQR